MIQTRWYHLTCLGFLLILGTVLRLSGITRYGLWRDEAWALYLATGRGDALFQIPKETLIVNPPPVGFSGAPQCGHIWTGLASVSHPPLYYFLLRWWVDCFGETDRSIRIMSLVFGVGCIALLFDVLRLWRDPWCALIGAAIFTFAPLSIDYGQQARPYTLIPFEGLVIASFLFRIERRGPSALKLTALGASVAALALTHYFTAGIIAATAVYAALALEKRARFKTVATIALAAIVVAAVWAPMMWHSPPVFHSTFGTIEIAPTPWFSAADAPQRMIFGVVETVKWPSAIALAILVYVLPAFDRRKLLWWLWTLLTIGIVLAVDLGRDSALLKFDRYLLIAMPAVCAILAASLPGRIGKIVPIVVLVGAVVFGVARIQSGPQIEAGSTYELEDQRPSAEFLLKHVRPGDAVVLAANSFDEPAFTYYLLAHYDGRWKVPVVFLARPMDSDLKHRLFEYERVWVVGRLPADGKDWLFPNCRIIDVHAMNSFGSVWRLK
jgi:hypothetical protein